MNSKANAVLLMAKTKALQDKPNRYKTEMCDSHTNQQRILTALPDAGRDDWARFKSECVLLKPTKRRSK